MGRPLRVLIIEDSEDDTRLLLRELRRGGYEVESERVETAEAMHSALTHKTWDLILSDYTLPGFGGLQALEVLKASGQDLPFILISGTIDEETAVSSLKAGASDFLIKGKFARLGPAIERELREAESRRERRRAQKALRQSEERFSKAFRAGPAAVSFTRLADGSFTDVNESFLRLFGYSREEVIGRKAVDLKIYSNAEERAELVRLLRVQGSIRNFEMATQTKSGEAIRVLFSTEMIELDGEVYALATILDITERKRMEEALRASQTMFQGLFDSSPDAIIVTDREGQIVRVNAQAETLFGYRADELLGQPVEVLLPARFREHHPQHRAGYMTDLRQRPMGIGLELYGRRKDGNEFPVDINLGTLATEAGPVVLATVRDITERKQMEDALRESEEKIQNIIRHSSSMFYTHTPDHVLTYVSPQSRNILDCEPEEAMVHWQEFVSDNPSNRQGIEATEHAIETGRRQPPYELELITRKGRKIWVQVDESPVVKNGKTIAIVGSITDITERRHAEEEINYHARLLRHINDAVIAIDDQFRITAWNRAAEAIYGWTFAEVKGRNVAEVVSSGLTDQQRAEAKELLKDVSSSRSERIHSRKNGRPVYVEENTIALTDEHHRVTGYVSVNRDITERKRVEDALRQSEERYRSLFEDSPVALWVEDLSEVKQRLDELKKNGVQDIPAYLREHPDFVIESARHVRILDVNSAAMKVYHARQKSELLGTLADVLHTLPPEQFENELIQIANGRLNFEREEVDYTLTGQVIHVNMRWSVAPGYEDSLAKVIVSTIDITERKRAEEALKEKEWLLSEAQRIGHIGSWSYEIATDTLKFSDEMYHLLDISKEGFQHNSEGFLGVIYSSDRPMVAEWMEGIRTGRQTRELEFLSFRKNGELRYMRCRGAVEFDQAGKPARFIGTAQDVTERKLAEIQIRQQVERLTALSKIDSAIISSFDLNVTLDILISEVVSKLQVDAADLLLLEPDGRILTYAAGKGFRTHAIETARLRMADSHAARERRSIHIENLENKPDERLLTSLGASEDFVCYFGLPLIVKGKVKGVLEVFHRTTLQPYPEWLEFLNMLAGQAAIAIENAQLFEDLERSNRELSQAYDATIVGWSRALDLRDRETEGHTQRVTEMTLNLARAFGLPEEELLHIRWGALLHDIGKMGVPDGILLKPGALTEEEWVRMRSHPQYAYDLLKPIAFLAPALDIPYCHHEKWDGTGYPRGLKGEEIPLVARLFAVVDVWDALRSDRPYRSAWTVEKARKYIRDQAGIYFDPKVVEYFLNIIKE